MNIWDVLHPGYYIECQKCRAKNYRFRHLEKPRIDKNGYHNYKLFFMCKECRHPFEVKVLYRAGAAVKITHNDLSSKNREYDYFFRRLDDTTAIPITGRGWRS